MSAERTQSQVDGPTFRARKKPGPAPTGRRVLVPFRMWASGLAALDERVEATRPYAERLGITDYSRSMWLRWAVAHVLSETDKDWIPKSAIPKKK